MQNIHTCLKKGEDDFNTFCGDLSQNFDESTKINYCKSLSNNIDMLDHKINDLNQAYNTTAHKLKEFNSQNFAQVCQSQTFSQGSKSLSKKIAKVIKNHNAILFSDFETFDGESLLNEVLTKEFTDELNESKNQIEQEALEELDHDLIYKMSCNNDNSKNSMDLETNTQNNFSNYNDPFSLNENRLKATQLFPKIEMIPYKAAITYLNKNRVKA